MDGYIHSLPVANRAEKLSMITAKRLRAYADSRPMREKKEF